MNCVAKGILTMGFTENRPMARAATTPIFM
jgi:hypothetical protein